MSIPPQAMASGTGPVIYDASSSVMGIAQEDRAEIKVHDENSSQITKDLKDYILDIDAQLDSSLTELIYTIKARRKEKIEDDSTANLSFNLTGVENSNITDLRLVDASTDVEVIENQGKEDKIKTLAIKAKPADEIIFTIKAAINKAKDARIYDLKLALSEDNENFDTFSYKLKSEEKTAIENGQDIQVMTLVQDLENKPNPAGTYKEEGIFGGIFTAKDTITWTDYVLNEEENKEFVYDFNLDPNQETENAKIALDYYEATESGFEIKKEFSQAIDFAKKINFEIPQNFIAKITLTTQVDKKNTAIENYSLNNRVTKNPIYIEGSQEKSSDDDEEGPEEEGEEPKEEKEESLPANEEKPSQNQEQEENKKADQKEDAKSSDKEDRNKENTSQEDLKDSTIVVKDSSDKEIPLEVKENQAEEEEDKTNQISALILNKDSLLSQLREENTLTTEKENAIENLAENLDSYNDEKITDQELKDFTKAQAENLGIEKTDLIFFIESILSGLNKQTNKAANLNIDEIIDYAYPENVEPKDGEEDKNQENPKEKTQEENITEEKTENPEKEILPEEKTENSQIEEKDPGKTFDEDLAKLKEQAKNEENQPGLLEGLKSLVGLTDLAKADKELKAALADEKNGIEEIQNLLDSFEEKYNLSRVDQAKLMDDNGDAIKALIDKDSDKNFRPDMLIDISPENTPQAVGASRALTEAEKKNLESKKFPIITRFDTSIVRGNIQENQYFTIHLDEKLKVNDEKTLDPIEIDGTKIATPSYNSDTNSITYKIITELRNDYQIPLNIPVDYNTENIKLDENGEFVVINKVSGSGVKAPKDLLPQRVDKNGNLAGSIIEPDRKDVTQIIEPDDSNYKIYTDAVANPVIKDGKLVGYNWTIKVTSDTDLDALGYKANFTTVKGSGLGEITSRDTSVKLADNPIKDAAGINDSKHHAPGQGAREVTYNLYTPTNNTQEKYMMDISIILTKKTKDGKPKVGAKRIVIDEGWPIEKVKEATPNRVGMNNRTTILGEFTRDSETKWTVTDAVSTGDGEVTLPLIKDRKLDKTIDPGFTTNIYKIDEATGEMVVDASDKTSKKQVGTIAIFTNASNIGDGNKKQTLSGVTISKYEDIYVDQNWNLDQGLTMPAMTVKAVDAKNESTELGKATTTESQANPNPAKREITIKDTKVWNIADDGSATRNDIKIKQDFPTKTYNGKTISYYENANWKDPNADSTYYIHNRATVEKNPQFGNFTLIKTGEDGKPLPGAVFKLLGQGEAEVATDSKGKIHFRNIETGSYQLTETKAPKGYKLNQETTDITVDENGRISASGSSAVLEVGGNPTVTVAHNTYPDFMNAMQYARVNEDGSVTTYIYLKANEAKSGGSTDKDTRLNLRLNNSKLGRFERIDDVKVYDVPPYYREYLKTEMIQQGVDQETIGRIGNINVLKTPNTNKIVPTLNVKDAYTQESGYRIKFPQERFANDWGFLVVANSPAGTSVTYDWLMDDSNKETVGNNAKLRDQTIAPTTAEDAKKETTLTISNEKFETRPVEVTKWDKTQEPIVGATFEIRDAETNRVIATVDSQDVDEEGKNKGLASFGDLPEGKYIIEEITAPEGYIKSDVVFDVTVDESNQVTYKPRFKTKTGTPINGVDYFIKDVEQSQDNSKAKIKRINTHTLKINEDDEGDAGVRPGVWEAYRLESLIYNLEMTLTSSSPGQRFSIQFDRNLDFTQYFGEFPKLNIRGVDVADPYFDYTTNKLTYVFNERSEGGEATAEIELKGIIPSKYFAQNDGEYPFTVTVEPGQTGITGDQTITTDVKADYGYYDYDRKNVQPTQSYYFRDVYKEGNDWYVAVLAYYNPHHVRTSGEKELKFNWLSTNYQGVDKNFFQWEGNGNEPAFSLNKVNVYRTSPNMGTVDGGFGKKSVNYNMPLSFGVRPGDDPAKYNLVYSRNIDPRYKITDDRQGSITLNYDPNEIQRFGLITNNSPLRVKMPPINAISQDGYIIEQTFKIDDMYNFNNLWRVFCMTNDKFKSSFITRANYNKAKGDQAGGEIPKFFSQEVALINKKYEPGNFKIKKLNDADRTDTLQGASFSLTDENNNTIYRSSGTDGIVEFSKLKPGIYTLREEKAPDKFIKSDKTWRVNVGIDGSVSIQEIGLGSTGETIYGKTIVLDVTNKPVATEFTVYKKDNQDQPLQGAEFKITDTDGKQIATGTSDANGKVSFNGNLENGKTYILEETKAPDGFVKTNKKWVLQVGADGKTKVYNKIEGTTDPTDENVNKSILGVKGTNWVNVSKRSIDGWILGDNRQTGYYNNWPVPYKLGTRIVGINTDKKYVIQRYVINPEAAKVTLKYASIHREKPWYKNMEWYKGDGTEAYKIFKLDKAIDGDIEDIRLENYKLDDITNSVNAEKRVISGDNRLYFNFDNMEIDKPIVIDVKVPYKSLEGGVGTGMDVNTVSNGRNEILWKSDYYEKASGIVKGEEIVTTGEAGNIKGAYISEGSLDVANDRLVQKFSFKKVDSENQNDAVTGATFSLKGPKKSDDDLGPEVWKRSGADGTVNFDNLTPGIYKLTETGPAQGYERSNTDWQVVVTKYGKIYIRDNNKTPVPEEPQWQKITNLTQEDDNRDRKQGENVMTYITEVDLAHKKYKQVFVLNRNRDDRINYLDDVSIELHSYPESREIKESNTKILGIYEADRTSTPDNIVNKGADINYTTGTTVKNGWDRIVIKPEVKANKTIVVEIEADLPSGAFGTGADLHNYRPYYNKTYTSWTAEQYKDQSKLKLEPLKTTGTDRNAVVYVGDKKVPGGNSVVENPGTNSRKPVLYSQDSGLVARNLAPRSILSSNEENLSPMTLRSAGFRSFDSYGLEIGDELVGNPVGAGVWETVDPTRSEVPTEFKNSGNLGLIREINKTENRIRQRFIVNLDGKYNTTKNIKPAFEIYQEPDTGVYGAHQNNLTYSVKTLKEGSTIYNPIVLSNAKLGVQSSFEPSTVKPYRYRIILDQAISTPIMLEVEGPYDQNNRVGLGINYHYNGWDKSENQWVAHYYKNESDVNTKYKITVDTTENGSIKAPASAKAGTNVTLRVEPDSGYELDQLKVDGSQVSVANNQYTFNMPDHDVNVIANFKEIPVTKYTVSFNPNGGSGSMEPVEVKEGETYTLPANGFKAPNGKKFKAWNVSGEEKQPNEVITVKEDVTIKAVWEDDSTVIPDPTPTEHTITINQPTEGGTISANAESAKEGTEITLTANPATGYVLDKFTVTSNGQDIPVSNGKFTMPAGDVNVSAIFKKSEDPLDSFVPEEGKDISIKDGETAEIVKITNKKAGITPKVLKRDPGGNPVEGAKFSIKKMTDNTYEKEDTSFKEVTGEADKEGNVIFKDKTGNTVKLKKGCYILKETESPKGYKPATSDWKMEVKDDGGRMYAVYQGPEETASSLINNNEKANAGKSASNDTIKYKARLTYIDPETKTYVQRIYIDTRNYEGSDQINVQIRPKYKREEIDVPGESPTTTKGGVKTAYYTAYRITDLANNPDIGGKKFDNIDFDTMLRTYDLSRSDLSMIKTARWRPFGWGFDEDQLNLDVGGVYIVDVEGFYDDVIITGIDEHLKDEERNPKDRTKLDSNNKDYIDEKDLGKLDLNLDFYDGARNFEQAVYNEETKEIEWKVVPKGNYQAGNAELKKAGQDVNPLGTAGGRIKPDFEKPISRKTSVDLNPLYNLEKTQEVPKEGLEVINERETYNITFSKHGRDGKKDEGWDDNGEKVTKNRLEGAVFRLEVRGPGGQYEEVPGTTVASAFNGYFGFRGLKPGRYRLVEVKAPPGYRPIKDPILYMTISYQGEVVDGETGEVTPGRGLITFEYNEDSNGIIQYAPDKDATEKDGKLVDYVTSATAKNMGKIINEQPGKGKVELTKLNDNKNILPGAKFKLTRLTSEEVINPGDKENPEGIYNGTVGKDGKLVFEDLPIGQYELEETEAPDGYINKGQKWRFTVGGPGLDPYINEGETPIRDISSKINFKSSEMTVVRPDAKADDPENNTIIEPHKGEALAFKNKFTLKGDSQIKEGDYFTIKLTDNIDLEGILRGNTSGLDLFADGVGTIAKAKYDKAAGTLTYIFTSYAEQYSMTEFENTISAHINLYKVPKSSKSEKVGIRIYDILNETYYGEDLNKNIEVKYDLDMAEQSLDLNDPKEAYKLNMTSKIVSFDTDTGDFVQYYYINRDMKEARKLVFNYTPNTAVSNLRFDVINLRQNYGSIYDYNTGQYVNPITRDMPESFGVNEYSNNLNWYNWYGYYNLDANQTVSLHLGGYGQYDSMILKVTGRVDTKNIASYETFAKLFGSKLVQDQYGRVYEYPSYYVTRTNGVRIFENKANASAELKFTAINSKNKITFKKVDQDGAILKDAKFVLYKKNSKGKWIKDQYPEQTSGEDGIINYEKLGPGEYALVETEAPEGYTKVEGHMAEFTVAEDGSITRKVLKEKETNQSGTVVGKASAVLKALANTFTDNVNTETVTETVGTEPIEVVNHKDIEFVKVDGEDTTKKLEGAEFEVYYKENETDKDYAPVKVKKTVGGNEKEVTKTVTSGENGKISLNLTKPGYYALKETKAPEGYTKIPGYIKEFRVENGKVQLLAKDPLKASHKTSTKGLLTSEILEVDKDKKTFKQRIVINPNHEKITVPSYQSYLRIKENDWKITPKYKEAMKQKDGVGGLVNVAILKKDGEKTLDNLTKDDFKKKDAINFGTVGNNTGSRYGLKEMLGETSTTDNEITTTDSIVMEFTGKLDDTNKTGTADQLFELVLESGIDDQVSDMLNIESLASDKPTYGDYIGTEPIQIENRKVEYPLTGGPGMWIGYTIGGLALMIAGAYVYHKRQARLAK